MELLKDKVSISGQMVTTILVHFKMEKNRVMVFGVSQKMMRLTFMMGLIKEILSTGKVFSNGVLQVVNTKETIKMILKTGMEK